MICNTVQLYGAAGSTTICQWKDNKTAAFTMSVDDNPAGEAPFIDSVCYPRGIKMTWYLETGSAHAPLPGDQCCAWGGNWDLWRSLAARGHDMGSHTVNHPCLTDLSAAQIRAELRDSKARIEQEIPNHKCLAIAWPSGCNDATVRTIASEYYIQGQITLAAGTSAMAHYPGPDHRARPEHGYRQVYDLNGKRVRPGARLSPGVYLAGQPVRHKIVVIR